MSRPDVSRPGGWRLGCRRCSLRHHGVPADGNGVAFPASVIVVGDLPSPGSDRAGRAADERGRLLLLRALADAGIEPVSVCFTHVVATADVHEIDEPGEHRLKPAAPAQEPGCAPWTKAELSGLHPHVVVLLGTTPARSLLGTGFAPRRHRGIRLQAPPGMGLDPCPAVVVTANPVSVYRSRHRTFDYDALVVDLSTAAACLPSDEARIGY